MLTSSANGLMTWCPSSPDLNLDYDWELRLIWTNINESDAEYRTDLQVRVLIDKYRDRRRHSRRESRPGHVTDVVLSQQDEELEHYRRRLRCASGIEPLNNVYVVSVDKGENLGKCS